MSVALDVSSLETNLPAAIVSAVASSAGGLDDSSTEVYVARTKRTGPSVQTVEAWLRPADVRVVEGGLGHTRREFDYELTIEKDGATAAELGAWARLVGVYFDGYKRPNVTGLWACRVEAIDQDLHDGEGPAAAVRLRLVFEEE